ncbi:hypothetical protein [Corynebacterium pacaense]|uniref:hypothetical protein n=1 Tax=Corynebacterium pacaense TaxID=1816684 RepID=UPI0011783C7B|nr:hypothetical protein [Corynebacterium pacaense]
MTVRRIARFCALGAVTVTAVMGMTAGTAGAVGSSAGSSTVRDHLLGKTSQGIHIYNNTLGNMVLTGTGGDSAGHQPVGETLLPGSGYHDFEVVFRAAKKTTDWATYDLYDPAGVKIGTATLQMSVDAIADTSAKGTFTALDGSALPLKVSSYSDGFQVVSNSSTPIIVDAQSSTAAALVANYCDKAGTAATCTFNPTSRTSGNRDALLAQAYTQANSPTSGTVSVTSGYDASSSTSWSVTVSADTEIGGIFDAGIEGTYGRKATWTNTFDAGVSEPVAPGYTGYIWGSVPVTIYQGTMNVKLGNSAYQIVNVSLNTPDSSRGISEFRWGSWLGNDPLNSPDSPPSTAQAVNPSSDNRAR